MDNAATNQNNLNQAILYHEIEIDKVDHTLEAGLFRNKPSDKEDSPILKTNQFLGDLVPKHLKDKNLNRSEVLYLYYAKDGLITNIENAEQVAIEDFPLEEGQALLEVSISAEFCYISDLDQFDYIMWLVKNNEIEQAKDEARLYWDEIIPLTEYKDNIERPEVLVTTDINPDDMKLIRKNDTS